MNSFAEGMRAYRSGEYPEAVEALLPLAARKNLVGRLARYYSALSHRAMGLEHLRAGRFSQAGGCFHQAIALIGNRADLAEYLLVVYARTGEYERCAAEAEVAARSRLGDREAQVRLAQAQWRSGRRPMAIMTLTQALRRLGDSAEVHLNLGLFFAAEENFDSARQHFARAVECDCSSARAYRHLGLAEAAREDFPAAARAFQRAWTLAPEDLMVAYQLSLAADASASAGRPVTVVPPEVKCTPKDSVIGQLAEYAAAEPDFVEAVLALPPSDADEELFGVIVSVLRTALAYHPDYADLHYLAALALMRLGDARAAEIHARKAVGINPRYVRALVQLAELLARRGAASEAVDHLENAVQAGADWPDVHARLGDLMKAAGMVASAGRHYRRALELNAQYQHAAEGLASLAA